MALSSKEVKIQLDNSKEASPKQNPFGSFEQQVNQTPFYADQNPLTKAKVQWLMPQCNYSQYFRFLTRKYTEPCGRTERPTEACENCQVIQPFFISLVWTREIPAEDVPGLGDLLHQTFLLPDNCRLLVFSSEQDAKTSPWGAARYVHGSMYVYVNQQGQQGVCFHCCKVCKRMELKPIETVDPTLFCIKGNANKVPLVNPVNENNKRAISAMTQSSRGYGKPEPSQFIFSESTFPVDVRLHENVLKRKDAQGKESCLGADDILCFFDDVLMPNRVVNNVIIIEVHRNPFEKLYRPSTYDNLAITVAVFRKGGRVPTPGLVLGGPVGQQQRQQMEARDWGKRDEGKQGATRGFASSDIIYKGTFRFYMRSPLLRDGASDSESDEDEQSIPKGVVAKKRYHMAENLQLAMTLKGEKAFYSLIQGYLRGGFFKGDKTDIFNEKSKRNALFTEIMKQDVPAARKYVAAMLEEVGQYYLTHCRQEPDLREGILQLLDFAHSIGTFGFAAFQSILKGSPYADSNKPVCFCFPRKFATDIRNVLVTASPDGCISEMLEGNQNASQQRTESVNDDLSADFEIPVFAKHINLGWHPNSELGKARDAQLLSETLSKPLVANFAKATGLYGNPSSVADGLSTGEGNPILLSRENYKDNDDPPVNPNFGKNKADLGKNEAKVDSEAKTLTEQLAEMKWLADSYPATIKQNAENESVTNLLLAVREQGYMSQRDSNNVPVSESTDSFYLAGRKWAAVLWPHDISKMVQGSSNESINEFKFVSIMGTWLNSEAYTSLKIQYTRNLHVSHLRKLFRFYTNTIAPIDKVNPDTPSLMSVVLFVQCVLLMLAPNHLQREDHELFPNHAPLDLACGIDCIYDLLCEPESVKWLLLNPVYRGPIPRSSAEVTWRAFKATETEQESLKSHFFLRLPEIFIAGTTFYGLNMLMGFHRKQEFRHTMLCVDVFDEQNNCVCRVLDKQGHPKKYLGDWLLDYLSTYVSHYTKTRFMPRKRKQALSNPGG